MSEYYMSHTGKELDDAINKVKSGYVLPTETINITSNVSNKDITNGKILNVNVPIPEGYIKPSGNSPTITTNGTHNVKQYENAVVNVQPSSDYIKIADTWNYTTRFAHGTYQPTSDTLVANISINVGFKPKVFFLRNQSQVKTNSSRYYLLTSVMVVDNDYNYAIVSPESSVSTRTGVASGVYYQSSNALSVQSNSINNCFSPTATGVAGNGSTSSSVYAKANLQYFWFAWG